MADKAQSLEAAAPAAPFLVLSPADEARLRELENVRRKQAAQDVKRAASGEVEMIAHTGFTLVTDEEPDGEEIRPGQRFTVSGYDAPSFLGRARLASTEAEDSRGATISPA